MIDVVSFGGGVQSTAIMTLAGEGMIPMPRRWVFSDPGFESQATYAHIERCKEYLTKKGAALDLVTAGNIRDDVLQFARRRKNSDVKRYASIPMFVDKRDGTDGILPRQCTTEYKIEPIERYHRREVLGLKPRQWAPKEPSVNVWIGISSDEPQRATAPGKWKNEVATLGLDLLGDLITKKRRTWIPCPWQLKSFPLLGTIIYPDRHREPDPRFDECAGWDRQDAMNWLAKVWPWPVPRSACLFCPYRTNKEWAEMRDNSPVEFMQVVAFDKDVREAYDAGQAARGELAGVPYLHRTKVPLDMADLSVPMNDRKGCGGLWSEEPDGICGV